jgi:hypothetical protein
MTDEVKRPKINPIWILVLGLVVFGLSYLVDDSSMFLLRGLQLVGIVCILLGIVIGSAKLNSKRRL